MGGGRRESGVVVEDGAVGLAGDRVVAAVIPQAVIAGGEVTYVDDARADRRIGGAVVHRSVHHRPDCIEKCTAHGAVEVHAELVLLIERV